MKKSYFMPAILLCLIPIPPPAWATEVSVVALFNGKAMVSIDGAKPRMLNVGQSAAQGVKLVSADSREAVLEIDGKRKTLGMGLFPSFAAAAPSGSSVSLTADARGHFVTLGSINGATTRFLVDTGASFVSLSAAEAKRLGIDFTKGERGMMNTANGVMTAYNVTLNSVKVGDITVNQVQASISEAPMNVTLLGMSFLNRVDMKREGSTMTLTKKY
ncbi:MAG: TIGR02281 family clan AA aspartic protease [Sulfuricellaceae bacterium]